MAFADQGTGRAQLALLVPTDQKLGQTDRQAFPFLLTWREDDQTQLHKTDLALRVCESRHDADLTATRGTAGRITARHQRRGGHASDRLAEPLRARPVWCPENRSTVRVSALLARIEKCGT